MVVLAGGRLDLAAGIPWQVVGLTIALGFELPSPQLQVELDLAADVLGRPLTAGAQVEGLLHGGSLRGGPRRAPRS